MIYDKTPSKELESQNLSNINSRDIGQGELIRNIA
jgi:hypothetical protein